jgi:hypothetical protein
MSRRPVRRQRERRAKPEKRDRAPNRAPRAQIHYIKPDPDLPHRVRLFLAANPAHMRVTMLFKDGIRERDRRVAGLVRHYFSKVTGRYLVRPGLIIAHMYLNARDLRNNPAEIISHECTHAGMAWARLRRANLRQMVGEEVLAYAVGRMTRQINRICHASGVFR